MIYRFGLRTGMLVKVVFVVTVILKYCAGGVVAQGNVGIGTESPQAALDVDRQGDGVNLLRLSTERPWIFRQTDAGAHSKLALQTTVDSKHFVLLSQDSTNRAASFHVKNSGSNIHLVPDGGEVGVGSIPNEDPLARLHVAHNSSTGWPQLRLTETAYDYARLKMENTNQPGAFWDIAGLADSTATDAKLNFYYSSPTGTGDRMTLTGDGRVGIGTTSPVEKVHVRAESTRSKAIYAETTGTFGDTTVHGKTVAEFGVGVYGEAGSGIDEATGVAGVARSDVGIGVYGQAAGIAGKGVYGETELGYGVYGEARSTTGFNYGVYGWSKSTNGTGVYGTTTNSGMTRGMHGVSHSDEGIGVFGEATSSLGGTGLHGENNGPGSAIYAEARATTGVNYGLFAWSKSAAGTGVFGVTTNGGESIGVHGLSWGTEGIGVFGEAKSGDDGIAIKGFSNGLYGKGLHVEVTSDNSGANAILAIGNTGSAYAGYFIGKTHIAGALSKSSGSFKIDHPMDPENKYLYHSFVESPDMMNIYNGNITTNEHGYATVDLPHYFDALNMEFRYQLTVIGDFAQAIVAEKINNNQFVVRTDKPNIEVSWQVTGVRKDPWAEQNRIQVEVDKEPENRGKYITPEVYGESEAKRINGGSKAGVGS